MVIPRLTAVGTGVSRLERSRISCTRVWTHVGEDRNNAGESTNLLLELMQRRHDVVRITTLVLKPNIVVCTLRLILKLAEQTEGIDEVIVVQLNFAFTRMTEAIDGLRIKRTIVEGRFP